MAAATLGAAALCFALGVKFWRTTYQASVQLVRRQALPAGPLSTNQLGLQERLQELPDATLQLLLLSPQLRQRVSEQSAPHVPEKDFAVQLDVERQRTGQTLLLTLRAHLNPLATADLANLYASNVVRFTEELLARDASEVANYLGQQLAQVERDLESASKELQDFTKQTQIVDVDRETEAYLRQLSEVDLNYEKARIDFETLDLKFLAPVATPATADPASEQLATARAELESLLVRYTENHPLVKDQAAKVERLQKALHESRAKPAASAAGTDGLSAQKQYHQKQMREYEALRNNLKARLSGLSEQGLTYARFKGRVQRLQSLQSLLATRQREARLYVDNGLSYYSILSPASLSGVKTFSRWPKIVSATTAGALFGLLLSAGLVLLNELFDVRLKTAQDVTRATHLPVLASLGDLSAMDEAAQETWAFGTWAQLTNVLSAASNEELVCGFLSAHRGEGRSTWVRLLAKAASEHGYRVVVVTVPDSRDARRRAETSKEAAPPPDADPQRASETAQPPAAPATEATEVVVRLEGAEVLANPTKVTQHLLRPEAAGIIEAQLPCWLWNRERRGQFHVALAQWRRLYNLVLLVDLPPAESPEAVLLAEYVPQLLWVVGSGIPRGAESRRLLHTLRQARCHILGAVLNREPTTPLKDRLVG
jgi:uncharacterized protein involved in exopolysaccharide biosynthesis